MQAAPSIQSCMSSFSRWDASIFSTLERAHLLGARAAPHEPLRAPQLDTREDDTHRRTDRCHLTDCWIHRGCESSSPQPLLVVEVSFRSLDPEGGSCQQTSSAPPRISAMLQATDLARFRCASASPSSQRRRNLHRLSAVGSQAGSNARTGSSLSEFRVTFHRNADRNYGSFNEQCRRAARCHWLNRGGHDEFRPKNKMDARLRVVQAAEAS